MNRNWTLTKDQKPPQDKVVETLSPNGLVQDLKLHGSLWFFPDSSGYVYYEIAMWREKEAVAC